MNYIIFHSHTMLSNATTNIDSVNTYKQYIDRAKELNMKAIAFSEHGSIFEWLHKKEYCEKNELKYIHAVEAYVTESFENKLRDNYHVVLIAKNHKGFKELNTLVSKSFNRSNVKIIDNIERFYYSPRISIDELLQISENIIVSTACLGGILYSGTNVIKEKFLNFLIQNKNRCFLEIQHHLAKEQIEHNQYLNELSFKYNIPLIAGTDTHWLDNESKEGRSILQKAKKIYFENESEWDLGFKSCEELIKCYEKQNSLSESVYIQAIENTNLLYEMVKEFDVDRSYKYPSFSDNPKEEVYKIIKQGAKDRKIELTQDKLDRIEYEMKAYEHNKAFNLLLLEDDVKSYARQNKIYYGDSRGSVSGSYIAYLMGITNVDSIRYKLNFERFMNTERVSLADVDTDWEPSKRDLIKDYLHKNDKYYTAEIVTFNTIADKGAIRDVGRALEMPLKEVDNIAKNIETKEDEFRIQYPELFKYVDILKGTIVSIGSHPAATICSPITLYDNIGTITLKDNKYPVSCLNMKEIDNLNFVKLDVLGLDNVEIIAKTCELSGVEMLTSDNVDDKDESVWKDILKSPLGIFQFTGNYAHSYLRRVFREEVLKKIRNKNPDLNYIDLMSMANGAIRPAGESYRESLAEGNFKDNGHDALNNILKSTNYFLVYQEQILEFLNKFCGFTMGEADIVRRGFAKKTGTEKYIPKIKQGFIDTMKNQYNTPLEESEKIIVDFLKVIEAASEYLFSLNHAVSYSYIGYICGWLRYHYPLEFLSVILNIYENDQNKTSEAFEYIQNFTNIKVKPIKFRRSKDVYTIDKEENSIYKGIKSIKYCNNAMAEELYSLKNNQYDSFTTSLYDINNTCVDSKQLLILIKLDFFREFGISKNLEQINENFKFLKNGNAKQIDATKIENEVIKNIIKRYSRLSPSGKTFMDLDCKSILKELEEYINVSNNKDYTIQEKMEFQKEYLGYIDLTTEKEEDRKKLMVLEVNELISKFGEPKPWCYVIDEISIGSGKKNRLNIHPATFNKNPLHKNDILFAKNVKKNNKGYWYLLDYDIIKDI
jgi:DNA polymerase III subunit alpha